MRAGRTPGRWQDEDVLTHGKTDRIRAAPSGLAGAVALAALVLVALPGAAGAQPAANSAHEITFWTGADQVVSLTDAQLDAFADMGVGGFVMQTKFLTDGWTDDPDANLNRAGKYALQRQIRDSRIVQRAAARGIDLYLGFFAANAANDSTPYSDWFDDEGWARTAEKMGGLAGAARMLGFRGIAIDQELYGGKARWTWNYPGNTHTEAEVRAKAKQRGRAGDDGDPGRLPRGRDRRSTTSCRRTRGYEFVYEETGSRPYPGAPSTDPFGPRVDIDFWDGMTSVEGYSAIRQWNFVFGKNWQLGNGPREHAQVGERDASGRLEHRRAPLEGVRELGLRRSALPLVTVHLDQRRSPRVVIRRRATAQLRPDPAHRNAQVRDGRRLRELPLRRRAHSLVVRAVRRHHAGRGHARERRRDRAHAPRRSHCGEDPGNGPRQPRGLGRPLAGQPRRKRVSPSWTSPITEGDMLYIKDWQMDWSVPREALTDGASSVTVLAVDIKRNISAPVWSRWTGRAPA